jgi:hypothetical protein
MIAPPLQRFAAAIDAACAHPAGGPLMVVSGLGPGPTGVGRMVSGLLRALPPGTRFLHRRRESRSLRALVVGARPLAAWSEWQARRSWAAAWRYWDGDRIAAHPRMILIHPQSLGIRWTMDLIRRRATTTLFAADASFFCLQSYNHRAGAPCLDCLGTDGGPARQHGCRPFPEADPDAHLLSGALRQASAAGKLRVLTQNTAQDGLVRRHLGPQAEVIRVGLWSPDWDDPVPPAGDAIPHDIVFHGNDVEAKGSRWALQVAAAMPEASFLFPYAAPAGLAAPANAHFVPCSWEGGLGSAVAAARIVLVPSLWSAPIEGALVKSMLQGRLVATVACEGAWSEEIPDRLRLRLDPNPVRAAEALRAALADRRCTDPQEAGSWLRSATVAATDQPRQTPAARSDR